MSGKRIIHTQEEIVRIRRAAAVTAQVRDEVARLAHPGMTTFDLDQLAGQLINASGGRSAFKNYHGYPGNICISVNDEVIHGIGRDDVVLYTGNDDNLLVDLISEYKFGDKKLRIKGGLLGHWSCWTKKAVELLDELHGVIDRGGDIPQELLTRAIEITDCNAAFFDTANNFAGCIPGLHEVLRRQGLLPGIWCLDPEETLSPGQFEEISRVYEAYPHLHDDDFVRANLNRWLAD